MEFKGTLLKMRSQQDVPIQYYLPVGDKEIHLNQLMGKEIEIEYLGEIHCILCGRKTSKSFFQGMCYPCFQKAPQAEECILHPELCMAHEGKARDMEYAKENCLQEHFVYLSYTGDVKVGVTRKSQVPTRWIDQGAVLAIKIASTPNRYLAGLIEVMLKKQMADKTNWRKMLTLKDDGEPNIQPFKKEAIDHLHQDFSRYVLFDEHEATLIYPVKKIPLKVKSMGFDKTPKIKGVLNGIKGQYLIFDDGLVLNIRKHGGYLVTIRL